jgi:polysaccharide biosynthesis transport protein
MSHQPAYGQAPDAAGMGASDILRTVRKRLWLILVCFVVVGLGGTAGVVTWWYKWPEYLTGGVIEVEPGTGQNVPTTLVLETQVPSSLYLQYVETQVLAIRDTRMLGSALDKLNEKGEQTMYLGAAAPQLLAKQLQVSYIPNTQAISVSLRGRDPKQIQNIVHQVLVQYIDSLKDERDVLDAARQKGLEEQRKTYATQLERLSESLTRYRTESSIIVPDTSNSEQMAKLAVLMRQLTETQMALAEASAAWAQFEKLRKEAETGKDLTPALMAFPEIMDAMRRDPSISASSAEVARYAQDLQGLKQRFGDKHEVVTRTQTALASAQANLKEKQAEVLGQLYQQQAAILKTRYERLRENEADQLNRVSEARTAAVGAARAAIEYRTREEEYRRIQGFLNVITEGLERMRISASLSRPNVHVKTWPDQPLEASEPRLALYIPAVIVFSLLIGLGLGLLMEVMDTRLRTPADISRQVGLPILGSIPDLTEDERLSLDTDVMMVSQNVPHALMSEAFRQVRTSLLFASDHPIKSILVTSPNPGDGKTSTAVNLAITMARGGARVVLVEATFRRPSLARALDVPETVGLSNVLVGLNTLDEAIQATRIDNLDVVVCGALPPSPGELLGSSSMRQLVQTLTQRYDQVVIDGAPMLVVADNFLLAEMVDGVALVFQAGQNTRGMALRAARQIVSLRARLLGAILNRVRATKGGYYREAFQAYYDYSGSACPTDLVAAGSKTTAAPAAGSKDDTPPSVVE